MNRQDFFKDAKWLSADGADSKTFLILRGEFSLGDVKSVKINVLGLGFFKCYINGECINPDTFLPLSSEYGKDGQPEGEIFSDCRVYVPSFDITPFVKRGKNTVAVHFGGGWYLHEYPKRSPKAIYCITAEDGTGVKHFVSDEKCLIGKSYISDYVFTTVEEQDHRELDECFGCETDGERWETPVEVSDLEARYCSTKCPPDKLIGRLNVKKVKECDGYTVYDCGRNTTGYPVLRIGAKRAETVAVTFSEELLPDGNIEGPYAWYLKSQQFKVTSDGKERTAQPEFIWYGFRYFEVRGDAQVECVKEIHADIPVTSSFECDNETLNWIYKTFTHTMLSNMHTGHPSDCPHLERRGYTGDGQLTCHASLSVFGAREFYEKWLRDIADGQDMLSGHIQYTAPYLHSGGGPGGWGSAIVEVPYRLYRHFGDPAILEDYYGNMRRYIDYLEAHSEFGLVTSDRKGEWCLGDWCAPNILYPYKDITYCDQQVFIPAPFVNTYFMVKSLEKMCEIAAIIGKDGDISEYRQKIEQRKAVIQAAYFNAFDGNFVMNVQGANAFAVDLGLGNESTYKNMVGYYKKAGCLDTGIFATDILIRTLFEHGDGELAVKLLSSDGKQGFEHWRKNGATTFHEYWDSKRSRSHNHPMFGAVTAYFFEYLLGIKQKDGTAGYSSLSIAPQAVSMFSRMSGSIETPNGTVSVKYEKKKEKISFEIVIPENTSADFRLADRNIELRCGRNVFETDPDLRKETNRG